MCVRQQGRDAGGSEVCSSTLLDEERIESFSGQRHEEPMITWLGAREEAESSHGGPGFI